MTGPGQRPGLLEVGRVTKPHGLRGEVVVQLTTNRAERVAKGTQLDAAGRTLTVRAATPFGSTAHGQRWIVAFDGISDLAQAEALRDAVLRAPPLDDPDALWVDQLIGSSVVDAAAGPAGTVVAVQANPASDLLVLDTGVLIPLRFVVDVGEGTVTVETPPGLLDL